MRSLFADDCDRSVDLRQSFRQHGFGLVINHGDEVVSRLFRDVPLLEISETRQDRSIAHRLHQAKYSSVEVNQDR